MTQPERIISLITQSLSSVITAEQRHVLERELGNIISQDPSRVFLGLSAIIGDDRLDIPVRTMASILLKNSFEHYFDGISSKEELRDSLVRIYSNMNSVDAKSVKPIVTFILSKMMFGNDGEVCDPILVALITSWLDPPFNCSGMALAILSEYVKDDVAGEQLQWLLQEIFPKLYNALINGDVRIKHDVLVVLKETLAALEVLQSMDIPQISHFLDSVLPQWLSAMTHCLSLNNPYISYLVCQCVNMLQQGFPKLFDSQIHTVYEPLMLMLHNELEGYVQEKVHGHASSLDMEYRQLFSGTIAVEEAQQSIREALMLDLVKVITQTVKRSKYFDTRVFSNEIVYLLQLMQITAEQRESWLSDADAFVSETDDETFKFCVRIAVAELFETIMKCPWKTFGLSFAKTITDDTFAADIVKQTTTESWTVLEAYLYALEVIHQADSRFVTSHDFGSVLRNPEPFIDGVVSKLLGQEHSPFLRGRAFHFISTLARKLYPSYQHIGTCYLESINAFGSEEIPLRYMAMNAISRYANIFTAEQLLPGVERFFSISLAILSSPDCPEEGVSKLLELILLFVQKNPDWARPYEQVLAPTLLRLYTSFPFEHMIGDVVTTMVTYLVKDEKYRISFEEKVLPQVASSLTQTTSFDDESNAVAAGIDFMTSMIKLSPKLENQFYGSTIVPSLLQYLLKCPNASTHQYGHSFLKYIVYRDPLLFTQIPQGMFQPLIVPSVELIQKVLEPSSTESSSLYISDFACALIMKLGHEFTPVVQNLATTLLDRLQVGKGSVYMRCLLTVYLHLLYHPNLFDVAFETLKSDHGKLQLFVDSWVSLFPEFQPASHFKTSMLVMLKILTIADPLFTNLIVKGDPVNVDVNAEAAGRIITRSRAKSSSVRYQMIPFPVKGIQLILEDLKESMMSNHKNNQGRPVVTHENDAEDDDADDEEWEDIDADNNSWIRDVPVDLLFNPDSAIDDTLYNDDNEEERLLDHPASHVMMKDILKSSLKSAAGVYENLIHQNMDGYNLELISRIKNAV